MRTAMLVGLAAVPAVAAMAFLPPAATGQLPRSSVYAPQPGFQSATGGSLTAHFAASAGGPHTIAVVDPVRQVLGVYHVDVATGAITLKSVRQLSWDLQMLQFNSEGPSPQDVRGGLRSADGSSETTRNQQLTRTSDTEEIRRGPVAAAP